jgi:hypothetical protein
VGVAVAGKTTVRLTPEAAPGWHAQTLFCRKQVVLPVLGLKASDARRAEGATTSILIAPFATDGLYADYAASDLGVCALGG